MFKIRVEHRDGASTARCEHQRRRAVVVAREDVVGESARALLGREPAAKSQGLEICVQVVAENRERLLGSPHLIERKIAAESAGIGREKIHG